MNKFNRKFNNACSRFYFWQAICSHFNGFVNLLKAPNSLTQEDKRTLNDIHATLFECFKACKVRKNFRLIDCSERITGNHASKIINQYRHYSRYVA